MIQVTSGYQILVHYSAILVTPLLKKPQQFFPHGQIILQVKNRTYCTLQQCMMTVKVQKKMRNSMYFHYVPILALPKGHGFHNLNS